MLHLGRQNVLCHKCLPQAVVISDVVVLYVLKKRHFYKENKYQQVEDSEYARDYEVVNNPPNDDAEANPIPVAVSYKDYSGTSDKGHLCMKDTF